MSDDNVFNEMLDTELSGDFWSWFSNKDSSLKDHELLPDNQENSEISIDTQINLNSGSVQFVRNNDKLHQTVFNYLEEELSNCSAFCLSVAFINFSGIQPLLPILRNLNQMGVPGKIITTDYLSFTEPKALDYLSKFDNIELKIFDSTRAKKGFHTKGYIFKNNDQSLHFIIGSSNLTQSALHVNHEWNLLSIKKEPDQSTRELLVEFYELWISPYAVNYAEFIDSYRERYNLLKQEKLLLKDKTKSLVSNSDSQQEQMHPNEMQQRFINNLKQLIQKGEKKGLLISATGTGKTYASGFALRDVGFDKALFVVHREQILKQAQKSYKNIFGNTKTYGFLSGTSKEYDKDITFATIQTVSQSDELCKFPQDYFDIIVVDETHHVGAQSYQKIMDYFKPKKFCLGMTASPDRPDGFDIYDMFDHNIACDIRLQDALKNDFLCPFNYFGISDFSVENKDPDEVDFNDLFPDARVQHIIDQINIYGYSGDRIKGLIFVSTIEEAKALAEKFVQKGYRAKALSGSDSQTDREKNIEKLITDDPSKERLDFIITIDIFNEGVDIPEVNLVVLLRPTKSSIVFIQQLGRGLRKSDNKDFVVILDFIGEYDTNFLIPVALSGDVSYNKDTIRKFVLEGSKYVGGMSTIHFDEISKKRIFKAIDSANFSEIRFLKEKYFNLKHRLGRIPKLKDFEIEGEIDVLRFMDSSKKSYYQFLVAYDSDYPIRLSEDANKIIEFVSQKLAKGKRVYELLLLKIFVDLYSTKNKENLPKTNDINDYYEKELFARYKLKLNSFARINLYNFLTNNFAAGTGKASYRNCVFLKENDNFNFEISDHLQSLLQDQNFLEVFSELIDFAIGQYEKNYSNRYDSTDFVLYKKYSYEDVCWLLNWEKNEVPQNIGGYKLDENTRTLPIFVNYNKAGNISDSIKYEDSFVDEEHFKWISKSRRNLKSKDVVSINNSDETGIQLHLFVRKNKDDKSSKEFYYLGKIHPVKGSAKEINMKVDDSTQTAVEFLLKLEQKVRKDVYDYITIDDISYDDEKE